MGKEKATEASGDLEGDSGVKSRPWTDEECKQLRKLVDDLGLAEVLYGLANMVTTDHPDFKTGIMIRDDLVKSAKLMEATWEAN